MFYIIVPVSIRALLGYLGDNLERQSLFFLSHYICSSKNKTRVAPTGTVTRNSLMKRFEAQLSTILATQAIVGAIFILRRVGSYTYSLLTRK
ncbi:unnamed protein product [Rotaria magnacalcarata]|uniref:Uncharacterized protein n=1 Tax=Rotaria magnacalcarata TaxID=392030 RepID=A0A819IMR8_9BILA|nr:unnamed protein product [Rotaria magnacalcarata]CAF1285360.1 unnamed protein product [Rotaria magnacalcarata]CAF1929442.1 unnamed protein product [Rotaria magnacalcarata]CAF3919743.1 unnamed protein product [Rotaria magnacalcarata]CAF3969048.1 unnamed protein product [Rotaria magnacalcarata]